VTLNVTGIPDVAVNPEALDFGDLFVGTSSTLDLLVSNIGTDLLSVTDITPTDGNYVAAPTSFDLEPFASQTVQVTFAPTTAVPHPATLVLEHNAPTGTTEVPLTGGGLVPPDIGLDPAALAAAALPEGQKVKTLGIYNTGGSPLEWSLSIHTILAGPPAGALAPARVATLDPRPVLRDGPGASDEAPAGYVPVPSSPIVSGGATVLIVQNLEPWGSNANEAVLSANGIAFDVIRSSQLATTNLSDYRVLLVPSDQPTSFYSVFAAREDQVNDFVAGGGILEFHAAGWGWNGGNASLVTLPGGMGIEQFYSSINRVLEPGHPLMDGVPDPFFGSSASHSYFTNVPPGALHIADDGTGRANLVEYTFGSGRVVTGGQTFEYGYDNSQDSGTILLNMIPYVHGLAPQWLRAEPRNGVVPPGHSFDVELTFDATGLAEGDFEAEITIASNDPDEAVMTVDAIFRVGSIAAVQTQVTPETINGDSQGNWITARIELPPEYDPVDVVISTVRCLGTVPADEEFDPSGSDVLLKFDRTAVQMIVPEGDDVELVFTGEIRDTIYFVGGDSVRVIRPRLNAPNGGEILTAGEPFEITWDDPPGYDPDRADIFYTVDDGKSWEWTPIALGVQGTSYLWTVPDVISEIARARVYVYDVSGVFGYDTGDGVFEINTHTTHGPVEVAPPGSYALYQNAPNPFRPGTEIRFDLPRSSSVELRIFDVSGRLVRVLVDDRSMPGGAHDVRWDGVDGSGRRTAAGVYFYKLQAGEFRSTRRMVKLR
jgi:hypothetical protein